MSARRDHVVALEKGLLAIEAFNVSQPALTLSDVARSAGLTRASARRYLRTLTTLGYAEFDGKYFRLTPRIIKLGYAYFTTIPLPKLAQPMLDKIGDRTMEVASLAILDRADVVFVARSAPRRIMSAAVRVGARLPAYACGTGRILLGDKSDVEIKDLIRKNGRLKKFTPNTKTTPNELIEEIHWAKAHGYSLNINEIEIGMQSISVPVRVSDGTTVAAISVSMSTARMNAEQMVSGVLPHLRECARELAERL